MRPAHSYQSPSMTPPDEPDYEYHDRTFCDVTFGFPKTEPCGDLAIIQEHYDINLCAMHFEETDKEAAEEARTERMIEAADDDGREYPKGYDGTGKF